MTTYAQCRVCGRDIGRRIVAGMVVWGHVTNPGPNHHYAAPKADAPKSGEQTQPTGSFTTTRDVVAARRSPRHQLGAGATE